MGKGERTMTVCAVCGKSFERTGPGANTKTCSDACRMERRRQGVRDWQKANPEKVNAARREWRRKTAAFDAQNPSSGHAIRRRCACGREFAARPNQWFCSAHCKDAVIEAFARLILRA